MKGQNKVGGSARVSSSAGLAGVVSSHGGHVNGVQAKGEQDDEEDERCKLLFIDGIADSVSYHQIRELFCQHGRLSRVFVERQRKPWRKLRFGFIKFNERSSTMAAMDALDGLKIGGAFLSVKLAKFPRKHDLGLGKGPAGAQVVFKERYVPTVQVWQRNNDASSLSSSSWRDALLGAHNSCRDQPLSKEEESMILNLPRFDDEVSAIPVESLFPEYFFARGGS